MADDTICTAFVGDRRLATGPLIDVALAAKAAEGAPDPILVFDDATGRVIDLDLRGSAEEIAARLAPAKPRGRPKLGVIGREVTLLPRHWDWLAAQPGGASPALRRLVDEARRADDGATARKAARDACYRFLAAKAGDLPGYEQAIRALFADDADGFAQALLAWPADIAEHAAAIVRPTQAKPHEQA